MTRCEILRIEFVLVNHSKSDKDEYAEGLISVVTSLCVKLYGRRRA